MSTELPKNKPVDYEIPCTLLVAAEIDMAEAIPPEQRAAIPIGGFVRDEIGHETTELDFSAPALANGPPVFPATSPTAEDLNPACSRLSHVDEIRRKWHDLVRSWAVGPDLADRKFEEVCKHYGRPGRFYHTLEHVQNMLDTIEKLGSHARNLNAVKLAAWLHDVIYDSKASDNEERSAEYAERLCQELSIPEWREIAPLIMKTKTHDAGGDVDAQVLLDADLAILGTSALDYRNYAEQIRQEYAWVPGPEYRMRRREVLQKLLARPRIYHLLGHLEEVARHNIAGEIAELTAG